MEVEISEQLISDVEIYRKDIEPEILAGMLDFCILISSQDNKIVAQAAEIMTRLALINKSIEVLHPGNTAQYNQLRAEYGVYPDKFVF